MNIDPDTGEVLGDEVPKGPYVRVFHAGIDRILASQPTITDLRVLLAVWQRAPLEGWSWDSAPDEVAKRLRVDASAVHKALRRLVAAGLLERPVRGKVAFVKAVAWRGPMRGN